MDGQALIWALWAAATVFVGWLMLVELARQWAERRRVETLAKLAEPTPEELLEAQALGLIPPSTPSGPHSAS